MNLDTKLRPTETKGVFRRGANKTSKKRKTRGRARYKEDNAESDMELSAFGGGKRRGLSKREEGGGRIKKGNCEFLGNEVLFSCQNRGNIV